MTPGRDAQNWRDHERVALGNTGRRVSYAAGHREITDVDRIAECSRRIGRSHPPDFRRVLVLIEYEAVDDFDVVSVVLIFKIHLHHFVIVAVLKQHGIECDLEAVFLPYDEEA